MKKLLGVVLLSSLSSTSSPVCAEETTIIASKISHIIQDFNTGVISMQCDFENADGGMIRGDYKEKRIVTHDGSIGYIGRLMYQLDTNGNPSEIPQIYANFGEGDTGVAEIEKCTLYKIDGIKNQ